MSYFYDPYLEWTEERGMKIKRVDVPSMTIEQFADAHNLTMVITERRVPVGSRARYFARFEDCEIMDGGCLESEYGDGSIPEEAIEDYASKLQLKRVAIGAYTDKRCELDVPRLVVVAQHG